MVKDNFYDILRQLNRLNAANEVCSLKLFKATNLGSETLDSELKMLDMLDSPLNTLERRDQEKKLNSCL